MSIQNLSIFYLTVHKIYEHGSIAIEELFDIIISKKCIKRRIDQIKQKLASFFPSATRYNDSNTHNALNILPEGSVYFV